MCPTGSVRTDRRFSPYGCVSRWRITCDQTRSNLRPSLATGFGAAPCGAVCWATAAGESKTKITSALARDRLGLLQLITSPLRRTSGAIP